MVPAITVYVSAVTPEQWFLAGSLVITLLLDLCMNRLRTGRTKSIILLSLSVIGASVTQAYTALHAGESIDLTVVGRDTVLAFLLALGSHGAWKTLGVSDALQNVGISDVTGALSGAVTSVTDKLPRVTITPRNAAPEKTVQDATVVPVQDATVTPPSMSGPEPVQAPVAPQGYRPAAVFPVSAVAAVEAKPEAPVALLAPSIDTTSNTIIAR